MARRGSKEWIENIRRGKRSHGDAGHNGTRASEYRIWSLILQRCNNKNNPAYERYGGRGIKVCQRWLSYQNFLEDMGRRPSSIHTVERKNNDGDYTKENCVWLPKSKQSHNTSRNRRVEFNGESLHVAEWARRFGMSEKTLGNRLRSGWSVERALTAPLRGSSKINMS